jgi:hypothetical protein
MRAWHGVGVFCCVAAVADGAVSLAATPEPVWICCGRPSDCPKNQLCCSEETMGLPPCDLNEEYPGYCVTICIHPVE